LALKGEQPKGLFMQIQGIGFCRRLVGFHPFKRNTLKAFQSLDSRCVAIGTLFHENLFDVGMSFFHYSPGNLVLWARSELNGFAGKDS
jgi:hypothetical protein